MGCGGSKADHLPLVLRCAQRRDLVRAAANHRYALAAAHVSYFRSLKDVGDALRRFVDEELITASASSSSSLSSPSLILPRNSKQKHDSADESPLHLHGDDEEEGGSHLNLSSSSSEGGDSDDFAHHFHNHDHHGHGHESEDDGTHLHHSHHKGFVHKGNKGSVHKGNKKGSVHKGKGHFHSDVESTSSDNDYPRGDSNYFRDGFGSTSHYPQGGFNGYGDGSGSNNQQTNQYPYPYPYPFQPPRQYSEPYMDQWGPPPPAATQPWYYSNNPNVYYMKKTAPVARTVVQEPPGEPSYGYSDSYWNSTVPGYGGNYGNVSGIKAKQKMEEAPPPPPPNASAWDFFNPFDGLDNSYYSRERYGYRANSSSPDSNEVREREGIPDLEEETESEFHKELHNGNKSSGEKKSNSHSRAPPAHNNGEHKNSEGSSGSVQQHKSEGSSSRRVPSHKGERSSKSVPVHSSESSTKSVPSWSSEEGGKPYVESSISPLHQSPNREIESSISLTDSPEITADESLMKKKGVSFEASNNQDGESSKLNSVPVFLPNGTRDLREVVAEIRDEFETAAGYGKEVAVMLEVGKMPYQPSFLKVLSWLLYAIFPSTSSWDPPSMQSAKLASKTMKFAKTYVNDVGKDEKSKACNLSSTLDRLYTWEKKLYKEVKEEEKLRIMYEKLCKKLKNLDRDGAESSKIDVTRASVRRLLTKLNVSVKAIDAISTRIQKLRDEELQPQVAELIHGLIRMWKAMLKCHQKQFRAVMESKMRRLKANTSLQSDPASRATTELERELRSWSHRFNKWITSQKSYVNSLNEWLLQCLQYRPEETPDGPIPYSPGQLGAPPIFVICNDWDQAMKAVSEARVENAMDAFAASLRELWEKQDEEGRQRLRAEYLMKDYEKQVNAGRVSVLDDLKVDLDMMRGKLVEERGKHKDARRLVNDAAASSLQGGLVPIFKALEVFASEALSAHERVRLEV